MTSGRSRNQAGVFSDADSRLTMYGILSIGQSASRWYKAGGQYDAEKIADAMADFVLDGALTRDGTTGYVPR